MERFVYVLPIVMIVLDVLAGIVYACAGDWKHAVYWIGAAVLNAAVTL